MSKYPSVEPGEWERVKARNFKLMCCDCSLVHVIDIRKTESGYEMRFRRDNRATEAARRAYEFTPDDD